MFGRQLISRGRNIGLRCVSGIARTQTTRAVMSDAALRLNELSNKVPVVKEEVPWEKILENRSEAFRRQVEDIRADPSVSFPNIEKPAGSVNYKDMMPRGGIRHVEWHLLNEAVTSDAGRAELAELKTVYNEVVNWIAEHDKNPASIDWDSYHNQLDDAFPGFVALGRTVLEEAMASTPDIDLSPYMEEVHSHHKSMNAALETYAAGVQAVTSEIQRDMDAIETERSLGDLTTNEVLTLYPDLAAEIEKEIAEGDWTP